MPTVDGQSLIVEGFHLKTTNGQLLLQQVVESRDVVAPKVQILQGMDDFFQNVNTLVSLIIPPPFLFSAHQASWQY